MKITSPLANDDNDGEAMNRFISIAEPSHLVEVDRPGEGPDQSRRGVYV